MRGWRRTIAAAALAVMLTTGCEDNAGLLPNSSRQPYEIVVTGRTEAGTDVLAGIMSSAMATGLPRQEPAYDVTVANGGIGPTMKYARCIVMATNDSTADGRTCIRYERNVYSRPQLIIYVCTPSEEQMRADSARILKSVGRLIDRFETNAEIIRLRKKHNVAAESMVDSLWGRRIWIAADIEAKKTGKDFVWFSDNSATAMRNICIYSYPGTEFDAARAVRMRDSIMQANIPGETPQMYMQTATWPAPEASVTTDAEGRRTMVMRGLWEMKGDAMGGPFVSHGVADSTTGRIITAEAFVFAPGKKKRNIIRQLEAALYTLK